MYHETLDDIDATRQDGEAIAHHITHESSIDREAFFRGFVRGLTHAAREELIRALKQ